MTIAAKHLRSVSAGALDEVTGAFQLYMVADGMPP
jgi:hypothetical protein